MENQSIARVHYFERQFLRTQDFQAEQAYHLGMMRRHMVTHHSWGIVRGLELALDPDCNPVLQPGIAVDGYGRTLVWQVGLPLPVTEFEVKGSDRLDVWLAYGEVDSDNAPQGYAGCGVDGSGQAYYRTQEQPVLLLQIPDPTHPDPRIPPGVPDGDLDFDGTQNAPLSPTAFWPVYLGRVLRKREKNSDPWLYNVSLDGRPYAGLVGEMVRHPTDRAWVEIGTPVAAESDETRFAVYLVPPGQDPRDINGDLDPRLEITSGGQITLRGDAALNGSLVMEQGALAFSAQNSEPPKPQAEGQHKDSPASPRPWSIYRARGTVEVEKPITQDETGQATTGNTPTPTIDLRLEMAGRKSGKSQVVIGAWGKGADGKEAFQPCLTIDDNCNVTVERNLVVKGFIKYLNGTTPYTLTGAAALSSGASGLVVGAASQAGSAAAQTGLAEAAGEEGITSQTLMALIGSQEGRQMLLEAMMGDPNLYQPFLLAFLAYSASGTSGLQALGDVLDDNQTNALGLIKNLFASGIGADLMKGVVTWSEAKDKIANALLESPTEMSALLETIFATMQNSLISNQALTNIIEKILTFSGWSTRMRDQLMGDAAKLTTLVQAFGNVSGGSIKVASALAQAGSQGKNILGAMLDSGDVMDLMKEALIDDTQKQEDRLRRLADRIAAVVGSDANKIKIFKDALGLP